KTTLLCSLAPQAMIVAGDLHEHRLRTLRDLAILQGCESIHLLAYDGTRGLPFADASFDRVLVDAPCSGTGTLRHNPEIRWRIKPEDIARLSSIQRRILANAGLLLENGAIRTWPHRQDVDGFFIAAFRRTV